MKLCYDDTKNWALCLEARLFVRRHYSQPTELIDIINDPDLSLEYLFVGYDYLRYHMSEEELATYYKRIEVDVESGPYTFRSTKVSHSNSISNSHNVQNSSSVVDSKDVTDSNHIYKSFFVKNCNYVYESKYATNSNNIVSSNNIFDSNNVLSSNYIMTSDGVLNSEKVYRSDAILSGEQVSDSRFCRKVKNVKNCLFCYDISDKEYYLFNKPVDEWLYKMVLEQLSNFKECCIRVVNPDDSKPIPDEPILISPLQWFDKYPKEFFELVKTIPNYDQEIFVNIIINPTKI